MRPFTRAFALAMTFVFGSAVLTVVFIALAACATLPAQDKVALETESQLTAGAYCDLVLDGGLGVRAKIRAAHVETIGVLRRNGVDVGDGGIACPP